MAYCQPEDLVIGNIPLPVYINAQDKIQAAADEMDSMIGFRYLTPIDVSDTSDVPRPARLILKRVNANLASGRLILELASAQEDRELHSYGLSLVTHALSTLEKIADGEIPIESADPAPGQVNDPFEDKVLQYNGDEVSQVDAFYDYFKTPRVYG